MVPFTDELFFAFIEQLQAGAALVTAMQIRTAIGLARLMKPEFLDETSQRAMQLYNGDSRTLLVKALKAQFPSTLEEEWPINALPLMKMFARADAGVYAKPPDRWLDDADGKRIDTDNDRSTLWAWALKKSRFSYKMKEIERRTYIPPRSVFGEVVYHFPPGDKIGKPHVHLYPVHHVEVLCHWNASATWEFAFLVALRQARPTARATGEWWKVYSRQPPPDIDGEWGPWYVTTMSTLGEVATMVGTPQLYEGKRLPVFRVQPEDAEGSVFANVDRDMVEVVLNLNVQRIDELFTLGRQGHSQLWTDDISDVGELTQGPNKILKVAANSTLGVLAYNAPLADARESRKQALREISLARGNSPHTYDEESSVPSSGIAKKIDNVSHDERVAESAEIFEVLEEEEPAAALLDVVRTFHPQGKSLAGCVARVQTRRAPVLEDPLQRQQRLSAAAQSGWISPERAATEAEYYPDVAAAELAMEDLEPTPQVMPAAAARADLAASVEDAEGKPVDLPSTPATAPAIAPPAAAGAAPPPTPGKPAGA